MLFEMNIKDDKKTDFILNNIESSEIKNILTSNKLENNIKSVEAVLKQLQTAE